MPLLTFLIAMYFLPFIWAIAASILVMFSPHLISISSSCLTEALFGVVLLTAMLLLIQAFRNNHGLWYMLSSIVCGYAYLTNETCLLLPYAIIGCKILIIRKKKDRKTIRNLILFTVVFTLFPISWAVRNAVSVPPDAAKGTTRAISAMSHGTYPDFIYKTKDYQYFMYREDPLQPEFGSSLSRFSKILFQRVKEKPLQYITWYFIKKPYTLWSWNILQGQGDIYIYPTEKSLYTISPVAATLKNGMYALHPLIVLLAFSGIPLFFIQFFRSEKPVVTHELYLPIFIIFIYYTLLYMVFAPWPRYAIPLRPFLYCCSLYSLYHLYGLVKKACR